MISCKIISILYDVYNRWLIATKKYFNNFLFIFSFRNFYFWCLYIPFCFIDLKRLTSLTKTRKTQQILKNPECQEKWLTDGTIIKDDYPNILTL